MPLGPFGARLRYLRRTHHLTQVELAHWLGLARHGYISNLEAGRKSPSLELVVRIADVFGVTTDYLVRDSSAEEQIVASTSLRSPEEVSLPRLFGSKLRKLRKDHHMLQADLAQQLGLAKRGYISNLETGRKEPSLELVVRVADLFGISTDYLLRDTIQVDDVSTAQGDEQGQNRALL